MISLLRIGSIFLFIITTSGINAQQTRIDTNNVYGSDPLLYNGKFYTFYPPLNTGGNQFLADRQFEVGSATIRGVTYTDLLLNYDIYNQQLILKYKDKTDATRLIIISDAWLESFSIKGINFEMISTQDTLKHIFQVLGTGLNRILYYWGKDLDLENLYGSKNHTFSVAKKEMNVYTGDKILKYWNNKSFYILFPPEKRSAIKSYLHKYNINVKKSTDQTMTGLIYYCNALSLK
jgi:hypothetical protein